MLPEISTTEPNSPTARANASAAPTRIAGTRFGSTIRRKTVAVARRRATAPPPPSRGRARCSTGCTERTTNGSVTNSSASSTASCVNATLMPIGLLRPVEREQRQAGDDRRQRERQVDERVDERLAAEVVAHEHPGDAACPMTALIAAATSETSSVNRSAATAWRGDTASQNVPRPPSSDRATTAASGSSTMRLSHSVAMPSAERRPTRPAPARPRGLGARCALTWRSTPPRPPRSWRSSPSRDRTARR